MRLFQNRGKKYVRTFIQSLKENERLAGNKRCKLNKFIADTEELVKYNEQGIVLENLLDNLFEEDIVLKREQVEICKTAILEMGLEINILDKISEK